MAYGYLGIVATIFFFSSAYMHMSPYFMHINNHFFDLFVNFKDMRLNLLIENDLIIILSIILVWTSSTLIHLFVSYLSDFLGINKRRFTSAFVGLLILALSVRVILFTFMQMSIITIDLYWGVSPSDTFLKFCLFDILGIIITSVFNIYLLQNYFETRR